MSQRNKTIILVDDSYVIRKKLRQTIESLSHIDVIAEASNGLEALSLIYSLKPDIVILDIQMPGKNGIAVLDELEEVLRDLTVIIFSNYSTEQYQDKCYELGADYYLDKTKDFEQLKQILST